MVNRVEGGGGQENAAAMWESGLAGKWFGGKSRLIQEAVKRAASYGPQAHFRLQPCHTSPTPPVLHVMAFTFSLQLSCGTHSFAAVTAVSAQSENVGRVCSSVLTDSIT